MGFSYLDRDLLLAGPEVRDVARSFQEYWDHEITVGMSRIPSVGLDLLRFGGEEWQPPDWRVGLAPGEWLRERAGRRDIAEVLPHSSLREVGRVEFEADPPKKDGLHDWNTWRREISISEAALLDARERVLIQSNYLIFRHAIMNELPKFFERGVEILYSTNSMASTANILTYSASRKQRLDLVHMGFDVRELRPLPADIEHFLPRFEQLAQRDEAGNLVSAPQVAIHAKSIVIDDDVAIVGSHNFDPRSALYNTEALFVVWDEPLTAELKGEIELASGDGNSWICHHVDYIPVWSEANEVFAAVSRSLPILDIWPWRGYSMYQLREGHEPVGVQDPDFFEHYEKMGEMPEVDSTSKRFKTRFLSSIIAPFWNLL